MEKRNPPLVPLFQRGRRAHKAAQRIENLNHESHKCRRMARIKSRRHLPQRTPRALRRTIDGFPPEDCGNDRKGAPPCAPTKKRGNDRKGAPPLRQSLSTQAQSRHAPLQKSAGMTERAHRHAPLHRRKRFFEEFILSNAEGLRMTGQRRDWKAKSEIAVSLCSSQLQREEWKV